MPILFDIHIINNFPPEMTNKNALTKLRFEFNMINQSIE